MDTKQKWLVIEADNGWQIVIPDIDTKPHAKITLIFPNGEQSGEVAGWDCPCKPHVDWANKMIVHNSFKELDK